MNEQIKDELGATMTTLEKLKLHLDHLSSSVYRSDQRANMIAEYREILPRLIAALEMVEAKAKEKTMAVGYLSEDSDIGLHDGEIYLANRLLAVLEDKEAKGE